MRNCWVFDIDGTVANGDHRKYLLSTLSGQRKWDEWYKLAYLDLPHRDIIDFTHVAKMISMPVMMCTGRQDECRETTVRWLYDHYVIYDRLYMRTTGDHRDDAVIKLELVNQMKSDGFNPVLAFEDRDRVVKMWRDLGVRCLQVNYGDF
jgi:hypothetical protein